MIKIKRAFIQNATIEKVFNYALYRYSNKILFNGSNNKLGYLIYKSNKYIFQPHD